MFVFCVNMLKKWFLEFSEIIFTVKRKFLVAKCRSKRQSGKMLVVLPNDGWRSRILAGWSRAMVLALHHCQITQMCLSPDGSTIVSASADGSCLSFNLGLVSITVSISLSVPHRPYEHWAQSQAPFTTFRDQFILG